MKTEDENEKKKLNLSSKPEILDDFWNDCINPKEKKPSLKKLINQFPPKKYTYPQTAKFRNINIIGTEFQKTTPNMSVNFKGSITKKAGIRLYNSIKLFHPKNKSNTLLNNKLNNSMEKYMQHIYQKHPSVFEEAKENKMKKIKHKKAIMRCIGLYDYGVELQKTIKMNKQNRDIQKIKEDISLCTFKPKINKNISYLSNKSDINKYSIFYKKIKKKKEKEADNKSNKNIYKYNSTTNDSYDNYFDFTFKPKLNDPILVEKMFRSKKGQNRSISNDKENAEFILRYTKARDEYLIRRFKQLNKKDESYDNSLISLTKRLCNEQYRNYLNVNNVIQLFGETINQNFDIHSSIANFKGLTCWNNVPQEKKMNKKSRYIIGLRRNLQSLDLNDNNED
jgi:hypothetical protein